MALGNGDGGGSEPRTLRLGQFTDKMQRDSARGWLPAVFEEKDTLPRAEHHSAVLHRNRQLRLCKSAPDMCRHVVRAFIIVGIEGAILGRDTDEEIFEVTARSAGGILLN